MEDDSELVEKAAMMKILKSLSKKAMCLSSNYKLLLSWEMDSMPLISLVMNSFKM